MTDSFARLVFGLPGGYTHRPRSTSGYVRPMIGTLGPAAVLSPLTRESTLVVMEVSAALTHATGSTAAAHAVTSLPPIETVMRPIWPG